MTGGEKIIVAIPDGMADTPVESLGGRTPLEAARTPVMDALAARGRVGLTRNVPPGMEPGSDVAIMSIMGFDPRRCYTGRGPIEAAGLGVIPAPGETVFRCNLVTLRDGLMADYCAGHITSEEGAQIVATLNRELGGEAARFIPGVGFRNILLLKGNFRETRAQPPHDHLDKPWEPLLPAGGGAERLVELIRASQRILASHPVNRARAAEGKKTADSIWPWSGGAMPDVETYRAQYGVTGAVVTAVDLVRGLGRLAGLDVVDVEGATGLVDTNYAGKVAAALDALRAHDVVILHVEGIDEAAHGADLELKMEGIERFDALVMAPLLEGLEALRPYTLLMLPDHPTPLAVRTHTPEPVPFVIVRSETPQPQTGRPFSERTAAETGILYEHGHSLLPELIRGRK